MEKYLYEQKITEFDGHGQGDNHIDGYFVSSFPTPAGYLEDKRANTIAMAKSDFTKWHEDGDSDTLAEYIEEYMHEEGFPADKENFFPEDGYGCSYTFADNIKLLGEVSEEEIATLVRLGILSGK